MALSQDLISKFAKLTNAKKEDEGATLKGTYKKMNGKEYVQLEGSDIWTPVESTVEAEDGEKVKVTIKDHAATIIGNISSPSARTKSVQDLKQEVDEYGNTIQQLDNTIIQQGNSIIQMNNTINQQGNTINQHDNAIHQQGNAITQINNSITQQNNVIDQMGNTITQHGDNIYSMNNTITQQGNNINQMNNVIQQQDNVINQQSNIINQQGNIITQQGNDITSINNKINQQDDTIESMNNTIVMHSNSITQQGNQILQQDNVIRQQGNTITEHNADITILNSGFSIIDGHLTGLSSAVIDDLTTNVLNAEYAEIDFANINTAAVQKVFSDSGIIRDLVVEDQHITGELVGVTIDGDLINANTLKADRLVVKGSDGLYYKLNIDGLNNIAVENATQFVLLDSEPDDWETNWLDYYEIDNTQYVHLTGNQAPTWSQNTYYKLKNEYQSGLDGTNIVAKSITAEKISVTDLVSFGATIGGFIIDQNSIHSIGKDTVISPSDGLYLGSDGELALGRENGNHIKYYKNSDDNYVLDVRLNKLYLGASSTSADQEINSQIELSAEGLRAMFQSTGGSNLLMNSVGVSRTNYANTNGTDPNTGEYLRNKFDFWTVTGTGTASPEALATMSESGNAFKLKGPITMKQTYKTLVGEVYSVSFTYKLTKQSQSATGSCTIKLYGDQNELTVFDSDENINEFIKYRVETEKEDGQIVKEVWNYTATTTAPYIEIICPEYFIFEITDLIISRGLNDVWSQYEGEKYGKGYALDDNGFRLYGDDNNYTQMTNQQYNIKQRNETNTEDDDIIQAQLTKDRVYTDKGEFNIGYSIGKLKVMSIDSNNIIEYIDT